MTPRSALRSASADCASSLEYLAKRWTVSPRSCAASTSGSGLAPGLSGAANTPATSSPRAMKASSTALPKACWPTMTMRISLPPTCNPSIVSPCPGFGQRHNCRARRVSRRTTCGQARRVFCGALFAAATQPQGHGGTLSELAADGRRAVRLPSKSVDHAEPEPGPFAGFLCRKKRLERALGHLWRHSGPGVGYFEKDEIVPLAPSHALRWRAFCGSDAQPTAARHRVARINRKVDYGELELGRIDIDRRQIGCKIGVDRDAAADGASQQFGHAAELDVDVDPDHLGRLPPPEGEQLRGQFFAALDGLQSQGHPGLQPVVRLPTAQHLQAALQHRQEIVEIVRDPSGHLTERLDLLGLKQLGFGPRAPIHLAPQPARCSVPAPARDLLPLDLSHCEKGHAEQCE